MGNAEEPEDAMDPSPSLDTPTSSFSDTSLRKTTHTFPATPCRLRTACTCPNRPQVPPPDTTSWSPTVWRPSWTSSPTKDLLLWPLMPAHGDATPTEFLMDALMMETSQSTTLSSL